MSNKVLDTACLNRIVLKAGIHKHRFKGKNLCSGKVSIIGIKVILTNVICEERGEREN
jgi:hypothetical protein